MTVGNFHDVLLTLWAPFLSLILTTKSDPWPFSSHHLCAQVPSYSFGWCAALVIAVNIYGGSGPSSNPQIPSVVPDETSVRPAGLCQHSPLPSPPGSLYLPHSDLFPARPLAAGREGRPSFIIHWRTTAVRFHEIIFLFPEYNRSVAARPLQLSLIHWTL